MNTQLDAHVSSFIAGGPPSTFYRWAINELGGGEMGPGEENRYQAAFDRLFLAWLGVEPKITLFDRRKKLHERYVKHSTSKVKKRCRMCGGQGHNARSHE